MIRIYTSQDVGQFLDQTTARTLVSSHNRRAFVPDIQKLYYRNDDPLKWMSNIKIQATSSSIDIVSGTNGFGVKFFQGDQEPSDRVWDKLNYNQPIQVNNLGTSAAPDTSFYPFWVRVEVSPITDVKLYQASFLSSYVEHAV